jgi:hypothetical protein
VRLGAVIGDLLLYSRIEGIGRAAGAEVIRVDAPDGLDGVGDLDLVLVDWSARRPGWSDALSGRPRASLILFGPHTDLEAHADARAAGLGPMWARSRLFSELPALLRRDRP